MGFADGTQDSLAGGSHSGYPGHTSHTFPTALFSQTTKRTDPSIQGLHTSVLAGPGLTGLPRKQCYSYFSAGSCPPHASLSKFLQERSFFTRFPFSIGE